MLTLIFANGSLDPSPQLAALLDQADLIIAVDGGANHCVQLNITPDILLGDLDSIDPANLTEYRKKGIAIEQHPARKDATDLELALNLATQKGAQIIWLVGALGGRWDMSLGNIMLAAHNRYRKSKIMLLGQDCTIHILHAGETHLISGMPGQRVSLLPLKNDLHGVTLAGFEYPLSDHTISFGSTLGISNILRASQAAVRHDKGIMLCVLLNEK